MVQKKKQKQKKVNNAWANRTCVQCGKRCFSKAALDKHLNTFHPTNQMTNQIATPEHSLLRDYERVAAENLRLSNKLTAQQYNRDTAITNWLTSIAALNNAIVALFGEGGLHVTK